MVVLICVGAVAVLSCVAWAGAVVFQPARGAPQQSAFTYVTVEAGEVGASLALNTEAAWTPEPVGTNRAVGTVTSVAVSAGEQVGPGAVLYTVDLRPVSVARGEVPAFRTIAAGVQGEDVEQLQTMLTEIRLYSGPVNGVAEARTVAAIRAWQKAQRVAPTGAVDVGDVIFLPSLPARVSLDASLLARGRILGGGEVAVSALPPAPTFAVPVTQAQSTLVPDGAAVDVTAPDGSVWTATVAARADDADSDSVVLGLTGTGGSAVCGGTCGLVPVSGTALLPSRIVTVPTVSGLVVPTAALVSAADGTAAVVGEDGGRTEVTVVTTARGISVVEGVTAGTRVRVPAGGA